MGGKLEEPTRNQRMVIHNRDQGTAKKVLCVCTAGVLRSPTIANVLHKKFGHNTRAVGCDLDFALIPISRGLIEWSNEIVFSDMKSLNATATLVGADWIAYTEERNIRVLGLPDSFDYGSPTLVDMILRSYSREQEKGNELQN